MAVDLQGSFHPVAKLFQAEHEAGLGDIGIELVKLAYLVSCILLQWIRHFNVSARYNDVHACVLLCLMEPFPNHPASRIDASGFHSPR